MSTARRGRFASIDATRLVGISTVILVHTWDSPSAPHFLYSWPVPLYFILSGYLWVDRPLSAEWKQRYHSLVRPYAAWFTIIGIGYAVRLGINHELTFRAIAAPIYGGHYAVRPFTTFWFISALFFTCMLYRLTWRLSVPAQGLLAAAGLLVAYVGGDLLVRTPLALGAALPCVSLVMLGRVTRTYKQRLGGAPVGILLVATSLTLMALKVAESVDIKNGRFGTPVLSFVLVAATSIGLLIVAEAVIDRLRPGWATTISTLAKAGIVAVFVHPFLLYFLDVALIPVPLQFVLVLTISWALGLAALYSPAAEWLTGNRREPTRSRTRVSVN